MFKEGLPDDVRQALIDRFEGWEIVEFLGLSPERVVEAFEDDLTDNLEDVCELVGLRADNGDRDDD